MSTPLFASDKRRIDCAALCQECDGEGRVLRIYAAACRVDFIGQDEIEDLGDTLARGLRAGAGFIGVTGGLGAPNGPRHGSTMVWESPAPRTCEMCDGTGWYDPHHGGGVRRAAKL